jgi:hypothetical protein
MFTETALSIKAQVDTEQNVTSSERGNTSLDYTPHSDCPSLALTPVNVQHVDEIIHVTYRELQLQLRSRERNLKVIFGN